MTYNGWYAIKPNQTKPFSFTGSRPEVMKPSLRYFLRIGREHS